MDAHLVNVPVARGPVIEILECHTPRSKAVNPLNLLQQCYSGDDPRLLHSRLITMAPVLLDAARTCVPPAAQQQALAVKHLQADRPATRLLPALLQQAHGMPAALARGACAGALAATLAFAPLGSGSLVAAQAAELPPVVNETPVLDLARVVPSGKLPELQAELLSLER